MIWSGPERIGGSGSPRYIIEQQLHCSLCKVNSHIICNYYTVQIMLSDAGSNLAGNVCKLLNLLWWTAVGNLAVIT